MVAFVLAMDHLLRDGGGQPCNVELSLMLVTGRAISYLLGNVYDRSGNGQPSRSASVVLVNPYLLEDGGLIPGRGPTLGQRRDPAWQW